MQGVWTPIEPQALRAALRPQGFYTGGEVGRGGAEGVQRGCREGVGGGRTCSAPSCELLPLSLALSPSLDALLLASPESPAGPPEPDDDAPDPEPDAPCCAVAADERAAAEHPEESGVPEPPPRPRVWFWPLESRLMPLEPLRTPSRITSMLSTVILLCAATKAAAAAAEVPCKSTRHVRSRAMALVTCQVQRHGTCDGRRGNRMRVGGRRQSSVGRRSSWG